jgi:uracil-DNA glycosylase
MSLDALLEEISACRACAPYLPHTPRPVTRVSAATRILIAGQAPGRLVHETGLPFNDPSGVRLRQWMGIDRETFYGRSEIGVAAMAFCFPGTNPKGGDYPPPPRCAALWRSQLLAALPNVELTLLVGSYAQDWALSGQTGKTMTDTIANWRAFGPNIIPLPHPSWRNTAWLKRNPWFEAEVTPFLRRRVADILSP